MVPELFQPRCVRETADVWDSVNKVNESARRCGACFSVWTVLAHNICYYVLCSASLAREDPIQRPMRWWGVRYALFDGG